MEEDKKVERVEDPYGMEDFDDLLSPSQQEGQRDPAPTVDQLESADPDGGDGKEGGREAEGEGEEEPSQEASPAPETQPEGEDPEGEPADQDKQELIAGKFKSVEDLEKAYKEAESKIGSQSSAIKRLEKLVEQALETRQSPSAEGKEETAEERKNKRDLIELVSKAAIGEEDVDDDVLVDAFVGRILENPKVSEALMGAIQQVQTTQQEERSLRDSFFQRHEDMSDVPEWALYQLMEKTQQEVLEDPDVRNADRSTIINTIFDKTAEQARSLFRLSGPSKDGGIQASPGTTGTASKKTPAKSVRRQPSGTLSESGSSRTPEQPPLQGQEAEIAELFPGK